MLCYAWEVLKEKDLVKVDIPDDYSMLEFFSKILNTGTNYLIRKGLDRGYIEKNEELASIKGKIDFTNSLRKLSFTNAKSYCIYDELTYDVLHNQILKSTLSKLVKRKDIKKNLRNEISETLKYFNDISYTEVNKKSIKSIKLNRNNHFYRLLLEICLLITEQLAISEDSGEAVFKDFIRDNMPKLYERFIFNYYKKKLHLKNPNKRVSVSRRDIYWMLDKPVTDEEDKYLPKMQTDVSISIDDREIIIDAKFYKQTLAETQHGEEKLYSSNLYQLFSYIQNSKKRDNLEGILLYPTVDRELDLDYSIKGNRIKIHTVNLNLKDWRLIEDRLDEIVG